MQVQCKLLFQNSCDKICLTSYWSQTGWLGSVVRDIGISAGRGGSRGVGGIHPPPVIFKHVFDKYKFPIISNLFNNNKPYAPSTHDRKCTNLYKLCLKIIQKVLKWPLQYPLEPFLFSICIKTILPKKIRLKITQILVPSHWKIF